MGMTIFYRGTISEPDRIEEFEDRVIDMALEIGAIVRIWRSSADHDATRMVRGLILDLSPGQETISLLISPEGWLVPLYDVEAAENGTLDEPPTCFVKTQFGSVEGHVAVVELFSFLKQEFFPALYVSDESGYWDDRNLKGLIDKFARTQAMIDSMAGALRQSPLSAEAAEDPEIVALRVERVARQVSQALARPPEHPPVHFEDDGPDWDELDESQWDESYKEQRRDEERLHRAVEEQLLAGADHVDALENAMRSEGIIDETGESDEEDGLGLTAGFEAEPEDEAWRESLPPVLRGRDDPFGAMDPVEHPLQRVAFDLQMRVFNLPKISDNRHSIHLDVLSTGVGEIVGGLGQSLVAPGTEEDGLDRGLALAQLKRALRGAAFARGALFPLRADALLSQEDFDRWLAAIKQLNDGILSELARIREAREP